MTKTAIYVVTSSTVVLTNSGLHTMVVAPGSPRNATFVTKSYSQKLSAAPSAKWIWDGPGNNADCEPIITVLDNFTIKCLHEPLTVYIEADNSYTSNILGVAGAGSNWKVADIYNVPTLGVACGKKRIIIG